MNIVEFLEARIAEDEADARGAVGQHWDGRAFQQVRTETGDVPHYYKIASGQVSLEHWEPRERIDPGTTFAHIARHDPARVLAECKAKRAIIEIFKDRCPEVFDGEKWVSPLTALAVVYADHPDYNPEWRHA